MKVVEPEDAPGSSSLDRDLAKMPEPSKTGKRMGTKWARYEISSSLQAQNIRQHVHGDVHKIAVEAYFKPDEPISIALQASADDDRLLSGSVPQPADWLRAWRMIMDPKSWQGAVKSAGTEHYIAQIREKSVGPSAIKANVYTMGEVHRQRKRQWLREATHIFIGFDDKERRKLLAFKCDAASCSDKDDRCLLRYGARMGKFGTLPCSVKAKIEDWEDDYAVRVAEHVKHTIEMFCTPLRGERNDADVKMILGKIRGIVVDGALLKAARMLRDMYCPNCIIVCRDPSHIIRPSCRDPLHGADGFDEQYERLMGTEGVLKMIQDSSQVQDQLVACERKVLAANGTMGGGIDHILRHVAFIQPRFESFVAPRRRYICLLHAIAMLLVSKVGDMRISPAIRKRCEEALKKMTVSDCFAAGLAGDFSESCLRFLRLFDVNDHDPSLTAKQLAEFLKDLHRLFVEGYVLTQLPSTDAGSAPRWNTLTDIAMDQVYEQQIFTYGSLRWPMWGGDSVSMTLCKQHLASMSRLVGDVKTRLNTEFREEDLYVCMQAFDLDSWSGALTENGSTREARLAQVKVLTSSAASLCGKLDVKISALEWTKAVRKVLQLRVRLESEGGGLKAGRDDASTLDNRWVWSKALDCDVLQGAEWRLVVDFFKAFWDGTGAVERGLGKDKRCQQPHSGNQGESEEISQLYAMLAELHDEGPQTEEDMFQKSDHGVLLLNDFTRACAHQWVKERGRRFSCYKKRVPCTGSGQALNAKQKVRLGTDAYVKHAAGKAHEERLGFAKEDHDSANRARSARPTLLGMGLGKLMRSVHQLPVPPPSKSKLDFNKHTADKMAEKVAVGTWAGFTKEAPKLRFGGAALITHAATAASARQCLRASLWKGKRKRGASASAAKTLSLRGKAGKSQPEAAKVIDVAIPFEAVCKQASSSLSPVILKKHMQIIARGHTAKYPDGILQKHGKATTKPREFYVQVGFQKKFPVLFGFMKELCDEKKCRWKLHTVVPVKPHEKKRVKMIGKLTDIMNALVSVRLVA